jgi:hypothetical protein
VTWTLPEDSLRAAPERVSWFIEKFGASGFRHAGELIPVMRRNDPDESRITIMEGNSSRPWGLTPWLRKLYRRRADGATSSPPSPAYPTCLADDLQALARSFESARDQPLRIWNTLLPWGIVYMVFELVEDEVIAECVKSADQRIANPRPPWE